MYSCFGDCVNLHAEKKGSQFVFTFVSAFIENKGYIGLIHCISEMENSYI